MTFQQSEDNLSSGDRTHTKEVTRKKKKKGGKVNKKVEHKMKGK